MKIITGKLTRQELQAISAVIFGNLVKAVVDIDKEWIAVDAELHSDLEALLLEEGSLQKNLWGINLYPNAQGEAFIEFDAMINLRPSHDNHSRGVDSEATRKKIVAVVEKRIDQ